MKEKNGSVSVELLRCPTRPPSLGPTLISHNITKALCMQRQREFFHKCFTCTNSMQWQSALQAQEAQNKPLEAGTR